MGRGEAARCRGRTKVIIFRGRGASHIVQLLFIAVINSSIHHEWGFHYVILLFEAVL